VTVALLYFGLFSGFTLVWLWFLVELDLLLGFALVWFSVCVLFSVLFGSL
jgi:hypothetical protein